MFTCWRIKMLKEQIRRIVESNPMNNKFLFFPLWERSCVLSHEFPIMGIRAITGIALSRLTAHWGAAKRSRTNFLLCGELNETLFEFTLWFLWPPLLGITHSGVFGCRNITFSLRFQVSQRFNKLLCSRLKPTGREPIKPLMLEVPRLLLETATRF